MQNLAFSMDAGWLDLLSRLPADLDLDQLARETKAIQRLRGITEAADLLRLGLAHGPGGQSLKQIAAWCDASTLSQRGSTGTDWRIHASFDLASRRFSHLELTDAKGMEALGRVPERAMCDDGAVIIADRGYAKAGEMAMLCSRADGQRRDFIVRTGWNMLRLQTADGALFDLPGALRQMQQDPGPDPLNQPREWRLHALHGRGKTLQRLAIRLLILPVPPDKAEIARKKLRRNASRRQHRLDPNSELAAGFMMLATSLPPAIPASEICAVYRLRWQIELAFKRLKSLLHIDRLPTWTKAGSLSWLYAHLIFALLTDDMCQDILALSPSGSGQ
jgi:hypothetical protein